MKLLIDQVLNMLKALSDKTRLRIFWVLQKADTELCVCELIDILHETQYNVSRHLKVLKYANLVKEKKQGRFVYYSVSKFGNKVYKHLLEMISAISENILQTDAKRLKNRLALRKNGICVIGGQEKNKKGVK